MLGHPHEDFQEGFRRQRRQIANRIVFARGHVVENVGAQVFDTVMAETEAAGGERRIAAAIRDRGLFEHQHFGALFGSRKRGAERGIAGTHNDHVPRFG